MILDNLRSAHNVGSIFRTAAALGYADIALCGVSISPPSAKLEAVSRSTHDEVRWRTFGATRAAVETLRGEGYHVVALESCPQARPIAELKTCERLAWVVGNEARGVDTSLFVDDLEAYALPVVGSASGINVSCAFAAAAYYEYLQRQKHV